MDEHQNIAESPDHIGANEVVRKGDRRMGDLVAEDPAPPVEELTRLSEPQRLAMEAIFKGRTAGDAARKAGVSRSTLYRWQQEDGRFRKLLFAWKRQHSRSREDRLRTLGDLAINNVYVALLNGDVGPSLTLLKMLASQDRRQAREAARKETGNDGGMGTTVADVEARGGSIATPEDGKLLEKAQEEPAVTAPASVADEWDECQNTVILEENRAFGR